MAKRGLPVRKDDIHYTYREYKAWPEDERWELIDGVAYAMGGPTSAHQVISREMGGQFYNFLKAKTCQFFSAPFDVFFPRLNEQEKDDVDTIVQPDLLVVCDPSKVRENGIWGAPDLVVEILSPSTSRKDLREKYDLYQRSGVREYWVVDPPGRWVQQYILAADGRYAPEIVFVKSGTLVSSALPGLEIDLASVWPEF
jgi:Uma2 family endonuclease